MTQTEVRINHPDDLANHFHLFGKLTIVGNAVDEIQKYRATHAAAGLSSNASVTSNANSSNTTNVTPAKQPSLSTTAEVKAAYQTNNFAKIKELETKANNDVLPVYTNIVNKGDSAWVKVQANNGQQYYMAWSASASVWSYTESIKPATDANKAADSNTKYQAVVQFGTYSASTSIAGIHSYNMGLTTMVVESVIAMILAKCISGFIADGLGFLVAQFAVRLATAAAEMGLESFSFAVPEFLIGAVAGCLCFAIVFIGIAYLWNWLNRLYTIRVQVFNWDASHDWQLTTQSKSNAVNPGKDSNTNQLGINIDKMTDPNSTVYPPGFGPVTSLDTVCYYSIIIYQNDNTFAEGCSFAIQGTKNNNKNTGFTYAFQCPRWSNNAQYMSGTVVDPNTFLNQASSHWQSNPQYFNVTTDGTPIGAKIDALSGASDDMYNVIININKAAN
ncbi:hypothetical protein CYY_009343 [Polysphondylium violaceum]|uniref:Uncharacterized protein n=1 Tax=Polysphondylium violaceum TaxID=133409 RepID=A0A8J4PLZ8_9MYCE|nr:hypothetical protein CYY_009343 [Polysphondylium violaceum]